MNRFSKGKLFLSLHELCLKFDFLFEKDIDTIDNLLGG